MAQLSDFVHQSIQAENFYPQELIPVVWTVAHRGYSGGGRLDIWVYLDEQLALLGAAELAMSCGLDEDAIAREHFKKKHYAQVIRRYCETSPPSHVLAVQAAPLMQDPDTFFSEEIQVDHS